MSVWTFKDGEKELIDPEYLEAQLAGGWSLEDPNGGKGDIDSQLADIQAKGEALAKKYDILLAKKDAQEEKAAADAEAEAKLADDNAKAEEEQIAEQSRLEAEAEAKAEKEKAESEVAEKAQAKSEKTAQKKSA